MLNSKKKRLSAIISTLLLICVVFMTSAYALPVYATSSESNDILSGEIISNEMISNEMILDEIDAVDTKEISLKASDIPETLELSEMKSKGHIYRIREQEDDMNSVVFLNDDSTTTKYIFSQPIKYTDSNGIVKDKSTKLIADGTDLVMADNNINVVFPQNISQGISVRNEDDVISMTPNYTSLGLRTIPQDVKASDNNKVIYRDAFGEGVHLEYTAILTGVKEDIILDSYTGKNEFAFVINTNGLYPVKNPNGSCSFYNPSTDEIEAEMMQVFCIDAENHFAGGDITITQVIENQKYIFTVIPEVGFLTDENTVYPVTIDPTITMNEESSVEDTVIYSGKPTHNYGDHRYATVGYLDNTYKEGYYMVKFPKIATTAFYDDDEVRSAKFHIYTASGGNACSVKTYAYKYDWDEDTMTWNDFKYMIVPTLISTTAVPADGGEKLSIDITAAARGWKDEDDNTYNPDYGLVITATNSTSSSYARDFLTTEYATTQNSAYMPYLEIKVTTEDKVVVTRCPTEEMLIGDSFICNAVFVYNGVGIVGHNGTNFSFSSSDETVVTCDYGILRAISGGTATITVSYGGCSATFTVGVKSTAKIELLSSSYLYYDNTNELYIRCRIKDSYNGYSGEVNQDLIYEFVSSNLNPPVFGDIFDEANNKIILPQISFDGKSHSKGTITIRARSTHVVYSGISRDITIHVECSPRAVSSNPDAGIYKMGGRYITIGYNEIYLNNSNELSNLTADSSHGLGSVESYIGVSFDYDENDWLVYNNHSGTLPKKLFELIGNSRITCITTHGNTGNLYLNPNSNKQNVTLSASDINALHEGYFDYSYIVLYTACTSGSTGGTNAETLTQATVNKGAKIAIGFKTIISIESAQAFEYTFLSCLRSDASYLWSPNLPEATSCNQTVENAARIAAECAGISFDDVVIADKNEDTDNPYKNKTLAEFQ